MIPRDRVIKTLRFEPVDRPPYDLMEGFLWPELVDYFREKHGIEDESQIFDFMDPDCRWVHIGYQGPAFPECKEWVPADMIKWLHIDYDQLEAAANGPKGTASKAYTKDVAQGPLASAATVSEVEAFRWPDPTWWVPPDFQAARRKWPDYALVYLPGWMPLFWGACEAFGMEEALVKMLTQPDVFDAFIRRQHEFYMEVLTRTIPMAEGCCDIIWLGDDCAGQKGMLMNPDLWRRLIKPYLAEQVRFVREHGMYVLYHSCGAVRPILPDLIEIGINALLVFQTTARGMDPSSIASEFGGRLSFYGGIDVQNLLSYGTPAEVTEVVRANVEAFKDCGGYIVANSHRVDTIKGENLVAMCRAAREMRYELTGDREKA